MSDGSPRPTNWKETIPFVVWGVLVVAFGLTGVEHFVVSVGQYWQGKPWTNEGLQAAVAFIGMAGLAAMMIHGGRIREKFSDIRWLIGACMFAVVVSAFSPYVEQRRWPFAAWLSFPSANEIADAVRHKLPDAQSPASPKEIATEVARLMPQPKSQPVPTADEIAASVVRALPSQHSAASTQDYDNLQKQLAALRQENAQLKSAQSAGDPLTQILGLNDAKR
jgi:hypothetical protein